MSNKSKQSIATPVVLLLVILAVGMIAFAGWSLYANTNDQTTKSQPAPSQQIPASLLGHQQADGTSTIDTPVKVATADDQYFIYGAPAGQSNASPKKILITLHGTEGSAERDYEIWKPLVKDKGYALAALNWWDGSGDKTSDYSNPQAINTQIHDFLRGQGYTERDVVVLEGFSRGSANTYPIAAYDRAGGNPLIDVVVSSSGGFQNDYFAVTTKAVDAKARGQIFSGLYWILSCGGRDKNQNRDGCGGMEKSQAVVANKGATVLGFLSDPNSGHGALTTSPLRLTNQMFELIEQKF